MAPNHSVGGTVRTKEERLTGMAKISERGQVTIGAGNTG